MTDPPPTYRVRPMSADDGEDIALWRYPGPWAVYDSTDAPDPAEGFWSVVDADNRLVGFACFGVEARVPGQTEAPGVLDVGVGMRPDLVGEGRGLPFAEAVFAHARATTDLPRFRATVQDWNERSLRLLRRLGFERAGEHDVGEQHYVVLERDATPSPTQRRAGRSAAGERGLC